MSPSCASQHGIFLQLSLATFKRQTDTQNGSEEQQEARDKKLETRHSRIASPTTSSNPKGRHSNAATGNSSLACRVNGASSTAQRGTHPTTSTRETTHQAAGHPLSSLQRTLGRPAGVKRNHGCTERKPPVAVGQTEQPPHSAAALHRL